MRAPLLNIDLGELPDERDELYALAQIANIACGGHAGDDASMRAALARCGAHGTAVGAHPSYPDRAGFGRRALDLPLPALRDAVASQCARLAALAGEQGLAVHWMKPHGALYHAADADQALAAALVDGALQSLGRDFTAIGPAGGRIERIARQRGLGFAREGFADRGLHAGADGRMTPIPRSEPGALIEDPHVASVQAHALAATGEVDTLCVHGDTPNAVAIASAVRAALDAISSRP